ncbi:hypothetical protein NDU88_002279 [Pleurodeles waltl]|uniref:Uncharacterized protein n=1 Tax=Pleurodeles waltl TaxID=8319 RepID=A0AAV7TKQ6_PLEWA|nr:hypothetical protein NDU88_002279 [Pleurodeles waltl]
MDPSPPGSKPPAAAIHLRGAWCLTRPHRPAFTAPASAQCVRSSVSRPILRGPPESFVEASGECWRRYIQDYSRAESRAHY